MSAKKAEQKKKMNPRTKDYIYIGLLFVTVFIFLIEPISKGGFNASDNIASLSFENYLDNAEDKGEFPLWIPHIFSGMPSHSAMLISGDRWWDFVSKIVFTIALFFKSLFGSDTARVAFYFAMYGVGMYLLMRSKDKPQFISFFTAFAAVFSTTVITWIMIGHNTKPIVLAALPFVFLFVEKLRQKFSLLYTALLIVALHMMFEGGHVQMIFYSALALGLYILFEFISRLINKKDPMGVAKATGILVIAGAFAFLMSADRYFTVLEYTDYSTRGSAPLVQDKETARDESGGNTYDYATMWSFSPEEVMTFVIPGYYGFGKVNFDYDDYDDMMLTRMLRGANVDQLSLYWGSKTTEDSPPYMGILILFFALFGIIANRKNIFVQFLTFLSVFALFLSFGNNLSFLYDFFFYNIPMFNKFRAPSMVLALMHFSFPILAGYGLTTLFQWRNDMDKDKKKQLKYLGITAVGFLAIGLIYMAVFQSSYVESVQSADKTARFMQQIPEQYRGQVMNEYSEIIWDQMITDWIVNGFIVLIAVALIYGYVNNKLSKVLAYSGLGLLLIIDLWRVNYRPMDVRERELDRDVFARKDWVEFIKKDNEKFRIADFVSPSPNLASYWLLENVNGYHSAKLRIYQDMLDITSGGSTSNVTNPFVWNMLNVKYIVRRQQIPGMQPVFQSNQGAFVYLNPSRMPRAWFVDSLAEAEPIEILNKMKYGPEAQNFDLSKIAFLEKGRDDMSKVSDIESADSTNDVQIIDYENQRIKAQVNASGNNFLVFSEMYYPNWKAFIDGEEVEILKTNYLLRGIKVPEGNHEVELKYISDSFETGRTTSTATNALLLLAIGFSIFQLRKKKEEDGTTEE